MTIPESSSSAITAIAQDLVRAREAKGLTLTDIADTTLVNADFLAHIERGNMTFMPQTYVRAFLREYASAVGIDPAELMERYDDALQPPQARDKAVAAPAAEATPSPAEVKTTEGEAQTWRARVTTAAAGTMALIALGVVLWNTLGRHSTPVTEVPFSTVVGENEKLAAAPGTTDSADTQRVALIPVDSMVLQVRATDSVWVKIILDNQPPREYLFKPNVRMTWKAVKRFNITAGNAGALVLLLNNKPLAPLGKKGTRARDVELTRELLNP